MPAAERSDKAAIQHQYDMGLVLKSGESDGLSFSIIQRKIRSGSVDAYMWHSCFLEAEGVEDIEGIERRRNGELLRDSSHRQRTFNIFDTFSLFVPFRVHELRPV
jgi:hypothetical protein